MGMPLYGAQPPTGYSMRAESWVNSGALLDRMNFALGLGTGRLPGIQVDAAKLAGGSTDAVTRAGSNADQALRTLEQTLVPGGVSAGTHQTIAQQLNDPAVAGRKLDDPPKPVNQGVLTGLILGSPEFQRR